jgi:hypothetical protein
VNTLNHAQYICTMNYTFKMTSILQKKMIQKYFYYENIPILLVVGVGTIIPEACSEWGIFFLIRTLIHCLGTENCRYTKNVLTIFV